ncbi:MAG: outer membrane protein transport protein [Candidatus Omnitrophica bacterium]|nr:outer membrane protein transport protein [Candidatus Omnitrophota bacterium]
MRNLTGVVLRVFMVLVIGAGPALAAGSGAYRIEVPDAGAVGKGSAFAGQANTPAAVYYNPAGMTQIVGQAVSVGLSLIEPHTTYKSTNTADAMQMKRGDFPIPNFFYVTRLGTENVALGIGTTTAWGLTTEWMPDSVLRYTATKTEMINHDYYISAAYKINEQWSAALGLNIDQSKVVMERKMSPDAVGGSVDGNIRLAGGDTAAGFLAATMFKLNAKHQFGLMYRSAIHQKLKGKVHIDNMDPNFVGAGIFPSTSYETDVMVKSILPQALIFGYSFKPDEKWTINMDVEWTDWSSMRQIAPTYTSETDTDILGVLQNGYPVNKDWHSSLAFAMGVEFAVTDRWRLRTGTYIHQSPVPKSTWDPSVPDSDSLALTMGTGYDLTKDLTLDVAWSGIIYKTRTVNNNVGNSNGDGQLTSVDGKYRQWINLMYATATYKF